MSLARRWWNSPWALAPALLYWGCAFYFGSITSDPLPVLTFSWKDKLVHFFAFGFMQRTHVWALRYLSAHHTQGLLTSEKGISWSAWGTASATGALLEIWQAFLPHRAAEWADLVANTLGAACFAWLFHRRAPQKSLS